MSSGHSKHTHLVKPKKGKFHRHEYGLIGAPCEVIQPLCTALAAQSAPIAVGYADADHGESTEQMVFHAHYSDKISYHQINFKSPYVPHLSTHFSACDLVLVNGNHHLATKQLVLINPKKEESLKKKVDRLTDVRAFILDQGSQEVYPWMIEKLPHLKTVPIFEIDQIHELSQFIRREIEHDTPIIKGLVLAGGKSVRMGADKTLLNYHGTSQTVHVAAMLKSLGLATHVSVQSEKVEWKDYDQLVDNFFDLGPYGGILSAFRHDPNAAWLTVATDMPLIDASVIETLIASRDAAKIATCFYNPITDFPEPLITLWEPEAYPRLLELLGLGISCPRKALINSNVKMIHLDNPGVLFNVNTPEEYQEAKSKING